MSAVDGTSARRRPTATVSSLSKSTTTTKPSPRDTGASIVETLRFLAGAALISTIGSYAYTAGRSATWDIAPSDVYARSTGSNGNHADHANPHGGIRILAAAADIHGNANPHGAHHGGGGANPHAHAHAAHGDGPPAAAPSHGPGTAPPVEGSKHPESATPSATPLAGADLIELTMEELAKYDGSDADSPIYVALNRTVYDVSASPAVYGPGGMYATLAAKDASRAYVTTCFDPANDLVPWLQGVEEMFVPLWLSRAPQAGELDNIAEGDDIMSGLGVEGMMDEVKRKLGDGTVRRMQKDYYKRARDQVRAQVQSWEGMFERKGYPVVGKVVGVDEKTKAQWEKLAFCDEAKAKRPPMAESLSLALELMGKSNKININSMGTSPEKRAQLNKDAEGAAKGKKEKTTAKKNRKEKKPKAGEMSEEDIRKRDALRAKAEANMDEVMARRQEL